MAFTKQNIKNRNIEHPSRYKLFDTTTAEEIGEYDLIQITGTIFEQGTKVNAELLQRYEDSLASLDITISTTKPTNGWWYELIG